MATLPAITWMSHFFLISLTVSMTFWLWPWAVSTTTTSTSADQRLDPGEIVHARGRPHPQPAAPVLAGVGELVHLVDVPHRDQPHQPVFLVHQQQLLDLGLVENPLGLIERGVPGAVTRFSRSSHRRSRGSSSS